MVKEKEKNAWKHVFQNNVLGRFRYPVGPSLIKGQSLLQQESLENCKKMVFGLPREHGEKMVF